MQFNTLRSRTNLPFFISSLFYYFRFVFTVTDLDVACPAYQHFRECLNQIEDLSDEVQFKVSLVDDVPQCFQYKRTKELVKKINLSSYIFCEVDKVCF